MNILLGFAAVMAAALIIVIKILQARKIEQENRLRQAYMQSMQEFYSAIQNRIEATRRYRHDLARHIQTLESLLEQRGESAEMEEYMGTLVGRYQQLQNEYYCTDEIVNSILLIKKQQCDAKNIPLKIEIEDTWYGDIEEMDMAGLLHNLLDNAMEENERIPEDQKRGIQFSMSREGRMIWIDVKNYVQPGKKVTFHTQKENKEEHGIGMKIIGSLIDKYHGKREVSLDKKENLFQTKVRLNEEGEMGK